MLKYRFLKNSSRLFIAATVLLFLGNLVVALSALSEGFRNEFTALLKFPQFVVYAFFVISYLCLNDEKAAHRKIKDITTQKKITALKRFLVFVFVSTFFKTALTTNLSKLQSSFWNVVLSAFLVISSYSFFLLLLSLWYFLRDRSEGRVSIASLISFLISSFYTVFKLYTYVAFDYPILNLVELSNAPPEALQHIFCLLQYGVNIVMFIAVKLHYEERELEAEKEEGNKQKLSYPVMYDSIAEEKGYGMDNTF